MLKVGLELIALYLLKYIDDTIDRYICWLLAILFILMVFAAFFQVVSRYIFKSPLFWTEETSRYILVWISFLGATTALKRKMHVAVNFVLDYFPEKVRSKLELLGKIFILFFLIIAIRGGIILSKININQLSPALRISMFWPYFVIPLSLITMFIHVLTSIIFSEKKEVITK